MIPCSGIADRLPEFVGGDLASADAAAVRAHLIACHECRRQAGTLQRARGALLGAAASAMRGIDEADFTAMHRSIVAATTSALQAKESAQPAMQRRPGPWWLVAAAALLVCGMWFGMQSRRDRSVWHRAPTATPAASSIVVPWSGPRLDMRLLGDERPMAAPASEPAGFGSGLMGRHRLRALVDEGVPMPLPETPR